MTMTSSTSFITQCPQCATKFKVTHEQLNVSEGWVRCGRCNHIFDAKDHLIEPQDGAPPTATPAAADSAAPAATEAAHPGTPEAPAQPEAIAEPAATAAAEEPEDLATPRPSERWLKELSDTFSPTVPSATGTASILPDTASPAAATPALEPAMEPETAQINADAEASAIDAAEEPQWVATEPAEPITEPAPLPATTAVPVAAAEAEEAREEEATEPDNDIASFHDELAQWKAKQDNAFAEPTPDTHAPASSAASAFTDGNASPALIQASAAAQPPAAEADAILTAEPEAKAPEPQVEATAPIAKPAPETEEERAEREEEERLERYRAEFSETQELRFMREAEQKAFWRRPVLRSLMAILALLLTGLLAAQWAYVQRDSIAALSPAWKARMQQACTLLGCHITPLQSIEDLVLDGSTFQHAGGNRYTVSWTVRNRSQRWIETPALSLSLRNDAGQTLVRRTIAVGDIAQTPTELAPSGSWKAEQHLVLGNYADAVTGYQLQIFYPDAAN